MFAVADVRNVLGRGVLEVNPLFKPRSGLTSLLLLRRR